VNQALAAFNDSELHLQDAVLKVAARDYPGARRSADLVLQGNPEDLRALSLITQSHTAQNQRAIAGERIQTALRERPKSARLLVFWAQWLLENKQQIQARKALAEATAADPSDTDPLFLSAGLDFSEHQFATARNTLRTLFKLDERNVNAHVLAGQVEEAAGYKRDAVEHYRKALTVDSNNVFALNNLAYILSHEPASVDEALTLARKAKELEAALQKAQWPSIQLHLGLTYNKLGNAEKGKQLVATALAKEPKLADALQ
jgi:Tfp pilus assembly protein PilF